MTNSWPIYSYLIIFIWSADERYYSFIVIIFVGWLFMYFKLQQWCFTSVFDYILDDPLLYDYQSITIPSLSSIAAIIQPNSMHFISPYSHHL